MERPFTFIECKTTSRDEFEVTSGVQPTFALFFLKKGSFRLNIDGNEYIVKERDCVIFSDEINFFRTVIEPISFIYLKFRINPKCPFQIDIPLGIVNFKNKKRFYDTIEKYERLADSQAPSDIYYREHLLEDILFQAFAEFKSESLTGSDPSSVDYEAEACHDTIAKKVLEHINEHLSEKITVETLCKSAGTNPSTLNFKIRKVFSMSPAMLVEALRMKRARELLRNTTFKVSEIAQRCGYENIYYFSTVFSKSHGESPPNTETDTDKNIKGEKNGKHNPSGRR